MVCWYTCLQDFVSVSDNDILCSLLVCWWVCNLFNTFRWWQNSCLKGCFVLYIQNTSLNNCTLWTKNGFWLMQNKSTWPINRITRLESRFHKFKFWYRVCFIFVSILLFIVLFEHNVHVQTPSLPVKFCNYLLWPWSRDGSTFCDMGPRFFGSRPKNCPFSNLFLKTNQVYWIPFLTWCCSIDLFPLH